MTSAVPAQTSIGLKIEIEDAHASLLKLEGIKKALPSAVLKAAGTEAHILRRMIVMGIRRQAPAGKKFQPLAASTKKRKKSSKALIDKGDLIRSITVVRLFGSAYFVGVHKMHIDKTSGQPIANIAEVHEFGTKDGRIPARPYLRPAFDQWKKDTNKRLMIHVVAMVGLEEPYKSGMKKFTLTDSTKGKPFKGEVRATYTKKGNVSWKII